jgi:hypothetical protein
MQVPFVAAALEHGLDALKGLWEGAEDADLGEGELQCFV